MDLVVVATGLIMAVGLVGTLVPILPGLLLMWGAAVAYAIATGIGPKSMLFTAIVTGVVLVAVWLGLRLPQRQTTHAGVGTVVQLLGVAGAVAGFFVVPVIGAAVGFVLAIFLVQLGKTAAVTVAWDATKASLLGLLQASAAQFGAGLVVLAVWLVWVAVG